MNNVKYMAILHSQRGQWDSLGEERQKEILPKYFAWANKLKEKNKFEGGSELSEVYRTLKKVNGAVHVDGPFAETKEVLTGYFVFHASSIEEAAEICKECPALLHDDWVQVFQIPDRKEGT